MSTSWLAGLAFILLAVTLLPGRWLKHLLLALTKLACRLSALGTVALSAAWHFKDLLPERVQEITLTLATTLVQTLPDWLPAENRPLWLSLAAVALAVPVIALLDLAQRSQGQQALLRLLLRSLHRTAQEIEQELQAVPSNPVTQRDAGHAVDAIRTILAANKNKTAPADTVRLGDLWKKP